MLDLLRRERVGPHLVRVTLGGPAAERFRPLGTDQWFRLFLPVAGAEGELSRMPDRLTTTSYLALLLRVPRSRRPVLRAYTVRDSRGPALSPSGFAEVDVDVVVHGSAAGGDGDGPGMRWALTAPVGSPVGLLDEGTIADRAALGGSDPVLLVADESALPAAAGILAALPASATGTAVVEVPEAADRQPLLHPAGVELVWVERGASGALPGRAALERLHALTVPAASACWVAGEQSLVRDARRHLVAAAGVPKDRVSFTGYWRHGRSS